MQRIARPVGSRSLDASEGPGRLSAIESYKVFCGLTNAVGLVLMFAGVLVGPQGEAAAALGAVTVCVVGFVAAASVLVDRLGWLVFFLPPVFGSVWLIMTLVSLLWVPQALAIVGQKVLRTS